MAEREVRWRVTADGGQFKKEVHGLEATWHGFTKELAKGVTFGGGFEIGRRLASGVIDSFKLVPGVVLDGVRAVTTFGSTMTNLSSKLQMSTGFLQELRFASGQVNVAFEDVTSSASFMVRGIASGEDIFKRLGFSVAELQKMNTDDQFKSVATAIAGLKDPGEQAIAIVDAFGRSGTQILPLIRSDMAAATKMFQDLGLAIKGDTLKAADDLGNQITNLGEVWDNLKMSMGEAVMPTVSAAVEDLTKLIVENKEIIVEWAKMFVSVVQTVLDKLLLVPRAVAAVSGALQDEIEKKFLGVDTRATREGAAQANFLLQHKARSGQKGATPAEQHQIDRQRERMGIVPPGSMQENVTVVPPRGSGGKLGASKKDIEDLQKAAKEAERLADAMQDAARAFQAGFADTQPADDLAKAMEQSRSALDGIVEGAAEFSGFDDMLAAVSDGLKGMVVNLDGLDTGVHGFVAGMIEGATQGVQATDNWRDSLMEVGNAITGVMGILDELGISVGKDFQMMAQGASDLAKGLASGDIIQSAMGVIGIGKGIVGMFSDSPAEKATKVAARRFGAEIGEELAQSIADTAESMGVNMDVAAMLHLTDIMAESGKSAHDMGKEITDLLVDVASGAIPATAGIEELGKAFTKVVEEAEKGVGDRLMVGLIQGARAAGMEVPEIAEQVATALQQAVAGVEAVTAGIPIVSQEDATAQAHILAATFWGIVEEDGIVAAAQAMQPAFDSLQASLEGGGFDASAVLGPITQIMGLLGSDATAGIVGGIQGLQDALGGLADSGFLTVGAFQGVEQQAASAFAQLQAEGVDSTTALQAIAPLLGQLQAAAANYGLELDANTQSLVDQAAAAGIAFPTDPLQQVVQILTVIAQQLGADIPASVGQTSASFSGVGTAAQGAATTATAAWQSSASATVDAVEMAVPAVQNQFADMALFAQERGEDVSITWNQVSGELALFVADAVGPVGSAFELLAEVAVDPIKQIRDEVNKLGGAVGGVTGAVGGLGAAFTGLPSSFGGAGPSGGVGPGGGVEPVPFQTGGIVTGPTFAMVGEGGPEAIIPLDSGDDAGGLSGLIGGGSTTINLTIQAGAGADVGAIESAAERGIIRALAQNRSGLKTAARRAIRTRRGL